LEVYDLRTRRRERLYTTLDGLDSNWLRKVWHDGVSLRVLTPKSTCVLRNEGFRCASSTISKTSLPFSPARLLEGTRTTCSSTIDGIEYVGTSSRGVWIGGKSPRRLSPRDQICSNHIETIANWRGEIWLGSFDEGLCAFDGRSFRQVYTPFRMVNEMVGTPR